MPTSGPTSDSTDARRLRVRHAVDMTDKNTGLIAVGTYRTRSDAELAQAALAAAGVQSLLEADDAGGAYPFDLTGGAVLLVDEADAESAHEILDTNLSNEE
jgi:hypothetical protein